MVNILKIPISALIFDAGDVLVNKIADTEVKAWYKIQNLLKSKEKRNEFRFTQIYEKIRSLGSIDEANFISIISGETFRRPRLNTIDIKVYEEYEIEKWWRNPDPTLLMTLKQLKEIGYKIGILTDSALTSEHIGKVLDAFSNYIDAIVSSRDIGMMKPSRRMYISVLSQLNVNPEKALFIAHDWEELEGAEKLGILVENFEEIKNLNSLVKKIKQKYVFST
jgi:HAD superfamily hydrolase (TIGR01549 family)